ncbi:dynein heavy chain [Reticulomyxa filosa]|uniref:Dynein heavy chain n=1 Tax=Reticulomyxa filosa TaxID=46433 RepID=X6N5E5_RETFI|nr:dynein heavy chain [Reticulomyxa filosa]|eukprot:ETO21163.1 dynein heavy chain [Reticulomyxa filosa]
MSNTNQSQYLFEFHTSETLEVRLPEFGSSISNFTASFQTKLDRTGKLVTKAVTSEEKNIQNGQVTSQKSGTGPEIFSRQFSRKRSSRASLSALNRDRLRESIRLSTIKQTKLPTLNLPFLKDLLGIDFLEGKDAQSEKNGKAKTQELLVSKLEGLRAKINDEQLMNDPNIVEQLLQTGNDAIEYFIRNGTNTDIRFVYCVRGNTPYDLIVVTNTDELGEEFYTITCSNVTKIGGNEATYTTSLSRWIYESTIFHILQTIPTFKRFRESKSFRLWRGKVRHSHYQKQRKQVKKKLFQTNDSFRQPLQQIQNLLSEVKTLKMFEIKNHSNAKSNAVDTTNKNANDIKKNGHSNSNDTSINKSNPNNNNNNNSNSSQFINNSLPTMMRYNDNKEFEIEQLQHKEEAIKKLEELSDSIKLIVTQCVNQVKMKSNQYFFQQKMSLCNKSIPMQKQREMQELNTRNMIQSQNECNRLGDFIRLADQMFICSIVMAFLSSLNNMKQTLSLLSSNSSSVFSPSSSASLLEKSASSHPLSSLFTTHMLFQSGEDAARVPKQIDTCFSITNTDIKDSIITLIEHYIQAFDLVPRLVYVTNFRPLIATASCCRKGKLEGCGEGMARGSCIANDSDNGNSNGNGEEEDIGTFNPTKLHIIIHQDKHFEQCVNDIFHLIDKDFRRCQDISSKLDEFKLIHLQNMDWKCDDNKYKQFMDRFGAQVNMNKLVSTLDGGNGEDIILDLSVNMLMKDISDRNHSNEKIENKFITQYHSGIYFVDCKILKEELKVQGDMILKELKQVVAHLFHFKCMSIVHRFSLHLNYLKKKQFSPLLFAPNDQIASNSSFILPPLSQQSEPPTLETYAANVSKFKEIKLELNSIKEKHIIEISQLTVLIKNNHIDISASDRVLHKDMETMKVELEHQIIDYENEIALKKSIYVDQLSKQIQLSMQKIQALLNKLEAFMADWLNKFISSNSGSTKEAFSSNLDQILSQYLKHEISLEINDIKENTEKIQYYQTLFDETKYDFKTFTKCLAIFNALCVFFQVWKNFKVFLDQQLLLTLHEFQDSVFQNFLSNSLDEISAQDKIIQHNQVNQMFKYLKEQVFGYWQNAVDIIQKLKISIKTSKDWEILLSKLQMPVTKSNQRLTLNKLKVLGIFERKDIGNYI